MYRPVFSRLLRWGHLIFLKPLLCLTLLVVTPSLLANGLAISPSQLSALQALSPAEVEALARQYGVDVGALLGAEQSFPANDPSTPTISVTPRELYPEYEGGDGQNGQNQDVQAQGQEALKPFGYELFAGEPTSFEPVTDVPVSSNYVLGPGDSLKVQLYGKQSSAFEVTVDTQGQIQFPELGPISVGGLSFSEAKEQLAATVERRMIGVQASIAIGQLRSIRVFVLGDAYLPGSYVVSSLSTMTNALVLSGGIAQTGSLRNIQLKRKGRLIKTLDLYDLLLKGDNEADVGLRSGDVVFIPPVGSTMAVDGEVLRPAIYELKKGESVKDALRYAGGLTPNAYPHAAVLTRVGEGFERIVKNLDLSQSQDLSLRTGDHLTVPSLLDRLDQSVALKGHVYRPGDFSWKPGMTLSSLISSQSQLQPGADFRYGLIKRYHPHTGRLTIHSFSLKALFVGNPEADVPLVEGDEVYVFALFSDSDAQTEAQPASNTALSGRSPEYASQTATDSATTQAPEEQDDTNRRLVVDRAIEELRAQSEIGAPSLEVEVTGSVRYPGIYPLVLGMAPQDLIYAAGGLTEDAYVLSAEINRTHFDQQRKRSQKRFNINLSSEEGANFPLISRDVLQVRVTPEWAENTFIELDGEVRFPGRYSIHTGDTLRTVIERAGGVTSEAYPAGAIFTRQALQEKEAERLDEMRQRLSEDIAKAQLTDQDGRGIGQDVNTAQQLLDQLNNTPALGRLVIDLDKVISNDPSYEVTLEDGDTLTVPPKRNSVTVIGEVQLPTSQLYQPDMSHLDYIASSGGTTESADDERIYVIKANGSVMLPETSKWYSDNKTPIHPGDTVVVPLDADRVDQVIVWRDLSQIFYQIALGAAAVGSL